MWPRSWDAHSLSICSRVIKPNWECCAVRAPMSGGSVLRNCTSSFRVNAKRDRCSCGVPAENPSAGGSYSFKLGVSSRTKRRTRSVRQSSQSARCDKTSEIDQRSAAGFQHRTSRETPPSIVSSSCGVFSISAMAGRMVVGGLGCIDGLPVEKIVVAFGRLMSERTDSQNLDAKNEEPLDGRPDGGNCRVDGRPVFSDESFGNGEAARDAIQSGEHGGFVDGVDRHVAEAGDCRPGCAERGNSGDRARPSRKEWCAYGGVPVARPSRSGRAGARGWMR